MGKLWFSYLLTQDKSRLICHKHRTGMTPSPPWHIKTDLITVLMILFAHYYKIFFCCCSYCHFLNCLGSILQICFCSLVFLDYISPFNICCKAGVVVLVLLAFACLKSFIFLHQFWMRSLPYTVILVVDVSLSIL